MTDIILYPGNSKLIRNTNGRVKSRHWLETRNPWLYLPLKSSAIFYTSSFVYLTDPVHISYTAASLYIIDIYKISATILFEGSNEFSKCRSVAHKPLRYNKD